MQKIRLAMLKIETQERKSDLFVTFMSNFRISKEKILAIPTNVVDAKEFDLEDRKLDSDRQLWLLFFFNKEVIHFYGRLRLHRVIRGSLQSFGHVFNEGWKGSIDFNAPINSSPLFLQSFDSTSSSSSSNSQQAQLKLKQQQKQNKSQSAFDRFIQSKEIPYASTVIIVSSLTITSPKLVSDFFASPLIPFKRKQQTEKKQKERIEEGDQEMTTTNNVDEENEHEGNENEEEPQQQQPQPQPQIAPNFPIPGVFVAIESKMNDPSSSFSTMQIPNEWSQSFSNTINSNNNHKRLCLVVVGDKNTGKSTLAQYFVNSLLQHQQQTQSNQTQTNSNGVFYLDGDIGQPEFTPTGLISLHKVSNPFFGSSWAASLRSNRSQPKLIRQYFVGDTTPKQNPDTYKAAMKTLIEDLRTNSLLSSEKTTPIVVNTQGWISGIGLDLLEFSLAQLIDFLGNEGMRLVVVRLKVPSRPHQQQQPQHYQQQNQNQQQQPSALFREMDDLLDRVRNQTSEISSIEFEAQELVPVQVDELVVPLKQSNTQKRAIAMYTYFIGLLHKQPIPFELSWNDIEIGIISETVPSSQILYSLNGSMIAVLANVEGSTTTNSNHKNNDNKNNNSIDGLPRLISEPSESLVTRKCLGVGILHSIDPQNKLYYVFAPESAELEEEASCLVRGAIDLPGTIMLGFAGISASATLQHETTSTTITTTSDSTLSIEQLPYMASGLSSLQKTPGSAIIRVRPNLKRKSHER